MAKRIRLGRRGRAAEDGERRHRRLKVIWRAYFIITSVIGVFTLGTMGFMLIEPNMTPLRAFHLTMQTITTVGYGDVTITTDQGRLFSDVLMVFGLAIATVGIASLLEFIVSGKLRSAMRTRDYDGIISRMRKHVIVCGYGRVGRSVVSELLDKDVKVVILDKNENVLEDIDPKIPRIVGDSTRDEDLLRCGIKRAIALMAAAGNDAGNLMTVVTAKYIKADLIAIARSNVDEDKEKFLKVGADMVISPQVEGGKSMAQMLSDSDGLVIIAGYGRVGSSAAKELHFMKVPLMVMDKDEEILAKVPKDIDRFLGDVTKEADIIKAGGKNAVAIIPVCGLDSANLMAIVTAKYYRPSITVISRASSPEDVSKMLKVGADIVISPEIEGGKSMARWAVQAYHLAER